MAHVKNRLNVSLKKVFDGKNTKDLAFMIPKREIAKIIENISPYGEILDAFINHLLALQNRDI
jgi:hypothetical protein